MSKHDHVGTMVHGDQESYCESCGQAWYLKRIEEKSGKVLHKWIPTTRGRW